MLEIKINMEASEDSPAIDQNTVDVICTGFYMICNKFKANIIETCIALGTMQGELYEEYGCLPLTPKVLDAAAMIAAEKNGEANGLEATIEGMCSDDYKERFIAEYRKTKIRYDKLDSMTVKYEAGTLDFEPKCSLELLKEQKHYMGNYLRCLKTRAEIEGIDLEG